MNSDVFAKEGSHDSKAVRMSGIYDCLSAENPTKDANATSVGERFSSSREQLDALLKRLRETVTLLAHDRVVNLHEELDRFAINVSLIGQVKAGKTALTNALIGKPDMLPSDVNPWTSVVTSVHINTAKPVGKTAIFNFFTTQEWLDMVEAGGTLGAFANRAGFTEEADEMRMQIREMQLRTEQRLGRNFKLLMGSKHSFLGFSPSMLRKYVCLGDETDVAKSEGRYADVTKSAELYMDSDTYRAPTIIHDTPGVNDPFLMREAVTLKSLKETDICVLVLGAQQSFSTVDVGLLRVVRSLKRRQIVFFVNRIDELDAPEIQIPEIDKYIRAVLSDEHLPTDIPIIFGSAAWAEIASFGMGNNIGQTSMDRLAELADKRLEANANTADAGHRIGSLEHTTAKTHDLSGLFDLRKLISDKSIVDIALPHLGEVAGAAQEVAKSSRMLLEQVEALDWVISIDFDTDTTIATLETLQEETRETCAEKTRLSAATMLSDMSACYYSFLVREQVVLADDLASGKLLADWKPEIESLRRALMATYVQFSDDIVDKIERILRDVALKVQSIYNDALNNPVQIFHVEPLHSNCPPTPICLMKTMPLDISTSWLSNWMPRKAKLSSLQRKFGQLVEAEETLVIDEMQHACVDDFVAENIMVVDGFFEDHIQGLKNIILLNDKDKRSQALQALGMHDEIEIRLKELTAIIQGLDDVSDLIAKDLNSAEVHV